MTARTLAINVLSHEWAVVCNADGLITWADGRAKQAFGARRGTLLPSLATALNEDKVTRFIDAAGTQRVDGWELVLRISGAQKNERLTLFSVSGAPFTGGVLIVGSQLPHEYTIVQEQLSATLTELTAAHRDVVQRELVLAETHRRLVQKTAELDRLNSLLARTARIDPLTGLGNRLLLGESLARLHEQAEREGRVYSLAFCDVDHFKTYNDQYGHPAGDLVLRRVAETLASCGRETDAVFRYGGEEILMLFPGEASDGALRATERACSAVRELKIPHEGKPGCDIITVSAGVSSFRPGKDTDYEAVLERADEALYRAKSLGRNRVVGEEVDCGDSK